MNSPIISDHMDDVLRCTDVLPIIEERFGIKIHNFENPQIIPGKPYGARVDIPFRFQGEDGKLITIAFRPGDGTGDFNTFQEGTLKIPTNLQFSENPGRVSPRAKKLSDGTPLPAEGMIPLFVSKIGDHMMIPYNSTLLELGIIGENTLGVIGNMQTYAKPTILLTVAGNGNERFGDPHAIFLPHFQGDEGLYQVAAFIAAESIHSRIFELLNKHGKRPPLFNGD